MFKIRDNLSFCALPQKLHYCLVFARMYSETLTLTVSFDERREYGCLQFCIFVLMVSLYLVHHGL